MGNRSNITFHHGGETDDHPINVYFHWAGTAPFLTLQAAIGGEVAKDRYGDPSYFTRICIHALLNEHADPNRSTGCGIGRFPDDNEHEIVHVYVDRQRIQLGDGGPDFSYDEFVALPPDTLNAL